MKVNKSNIPLSLDPVYNKRPHMPRDEWSSGAIRSSLNHPNIDKLKPREFDASICTQCGGRGTVEIQLRRAKRYVICECLKRES